MKVSDAIAKYLAMQGITVIFGYQGGAITHMIDSFDRNGIRYVQTYNEQGAALAADAYARVSKLGMGAAIATNGPGATNLITGIANAYCDSVPVLYMTGQVHTFAMKRSAAVRQESFQEIDILSMVRPITKYAVTVMEKEQVLPEMKKAIEAALSGRPGPVLVDLPVDVQGLDLAVTESGIAAFAPEIPENPSCPADIVSSVLGTLEAAKRPLILAGGGIRSAGAADLFAEFINKTEIPVACSLMGLDALDHESPSFVGYIGSYGNRYANLAVQNADVLLVLGSRLDMRQTGKRRDLFAPDAHVIHVDIDESELGHFIEEDEKIRCDVRDFLEKAIAEAKESCCPSDWQEQINAWKRVYTDEFSVAERKPDEAALNPGQVMRGIGSLTAEGSVVCADVGQNQMWLAQSLRGKKLRVLNSGGLGTMGYSLPAAIGAGFADPGRCVYAVMGDGGLQMNIQELQVVGQYKLPVLLFVMNNHALGLIRDVHEKYYESRYVGSVRGFSMPDLKLLAGAYRLDYLRVEDAAKLGKVSTCVKAPAIIEVVFDGDTYVRPELLGQDGLDRQSPYKE